jgi:hypothetical protein
VVDEAQEGLTLREVAPTDVLPFVARAACYAAEHAKGRAHLVASRGRAFIIDQGGRPVAGYVLQQIGNELWIDAAAGAGRLDLVALITATVQRQGRELDSIGFQTTRRGLVRKARRLGYELAGQVQASGQAIFTMRKRLR